MRDWLRLGAAPLAVLVLDQLTKLWLVSSLPYGGDVPVIHGFFHLIHTRNRGVAFGLLGHGGEVLQTLLLVSVMLLLGFVAWQLWRHRGQVLNRTALGLILGGGLGNVVDRLVRGEVVDFLDFYLQVGDRAYHWPAFNVADAAITSGALLLLLREAYTHKHAPDSD